MGMGAGSMREREVGVILGVRIERGRGRDTGVIGVWELMDGMIGQRRLRKVELLDRRGIKMAWS